MKKAILGLVSVAVLLSTTLISNAADQSITSAGTANILLTADIPATFEVTVPNQIDITEKAVKNFTITATGDIKDTQKLTISLPNTVTLTDAESNAVQLSTTIDKSIITSAELKAGEVTANCTIDATSLKAGEYAGTCDIEIQLEDIN